jgi:hypothetical protein
MLVKLRHALPTHSKSKSFDFPHSLVSDSNKQTQTSADAQSVGFGSPDSQTRQQ